MHKDDRIPNNTASPNWNGKSWLGLGLIAALSFTGNLITSAPAGWVAQQIGVTDTLPPTVTVDAIQGTLLDGKAGLNISGHPTHVSWQTQWPAWDNLTHGELPVTWRFETSDSDIAGNLTAATDGAITATASGHLFIPEFAHLIEQHGGAMIEGEVRLNQLRFAWNGQRITEARGLGHWAGGVVNYPANKPTLTTTLPPLAFTAGPAGQSLRLTVTEQGDTAPLVQADLSPSGMANLDVYGRLLTLADQPGFENQPASPVFQLEHPLFTYTGGR